MIYSLHYLGGTLALARRDPIYPHILSEGFPAYVPVPDRYTWLWMLVEMAQEPSKRRRFCERSMLGGGEGVFAVQCHAQGEEPREASRGRHQGSLIVI